MKKRNKKTYVHIKSMEANVIVIIKRLALGDNFTYDRQPLQTNLEPRGNHPILFWGQSNFKGDSNIINIIIIKIIESLNLIKD